MIDMMSEEVDDGVIINVEDEVSPMTTLSDRLAYHFLDIRY